MKRIVVLLYFVGCSVFVAACAPKPAPLPGKDPTTGCDRPSASVFTAAGVDLTFAESTFGKIVTGDTRVVVTPQVISLASKAAADDEIRAYLRCLAIKHDGYTREQAAYLEECSLFMRTSPTASQFLEWKKGNPFPAASIPEPELSPEQEQLLQILSKYQDRFAATKLVIGRDDGLLYFDNDSSKSRNISIISDLDGPNKPQTPSEFEALMVSMPPEYVRLIPETRFDSPFVVSVTERGKSYLQEHRKP